METKIEIGSCGNKKYGIKTIALFSDEIGRAHV